MRDLISIGDLSRPEIEYLLHEAALWKKGRGETPLTKRLIASCFFEPSTRTRLSFEAAAHRLGAQVIGFADAASTSTQKGESLSDTIRVIGSYVDLIVIRHPQEGSAQVAADAASVPVINAGDGAREHPTQTLIDLFTLQEAFGTLDRLHIAIAGDLKYARSIHSLAKALSLFHTRLSFISTEELSLPPQLAQELKQKGIEISYHRSFDDVLTEVDALYLTRMQKERGASGPTLLLKQLPRVKPRFKILHPLPRVDELPSDFDASPHALYFTQAANGVPVRMALLTHMLS